MKSRAVILAVLALVLVFGVTVFLRMPHKAATRPAKAKKKSTVSVPAPRKAARAKVAIVMDDFGYNMNDLNTLFSIGQPITLSVLPDLKYSKRVAKFARERGYEVMLHLPLEPHAKNVKEEADTIRSGMPEGEIASRLSKEIESVPGLSGVSNHMGSKSTEDVNLMTIVLSNLKQKGLYFFDSLTSEKSVCRDVAKTIGIKYAKRDIFLDNVDNKEYIEHQLVLLENSALKRGRMTAVCHDRKNTIAALVKMMPRMSHDGVEFVFLKEMVR